MYAEADKQGVMLQVDTRSVGPQGHYGVLQLVC